MLHEQYTGFCPLEFLFEGMLSTFLVLILIFFSDWDRLVFIMTPKHNFTNQYKTKFVTVNITTIIKGRNLVFFTYFFSKSFLLPKSIRTSVTHYSFNLGISCILYQGNLRFLNNVKYKICYSTFDDVRLSIHICLALLL